MILPTGSNITSEFPESKKDMQMASPLVQPKLFAACVLFIQSKELKS